MNDDIMMISKPTITTAQAAKYIPCSPYSLTLAARDPELREKLGFPVIVLGNRVRIPRIPFLQFLGLLPADAPNEKPV